MSESDTDPPPGVLRESIISREGIKVIRMTIPAGLAIPEHHTSTHLIAVVVRGTGSFTVADEPIPLRQGVVVDVLPGVRHAIVAGDEELELVVTHARLAEEREPVEACAP